MGDRSREFAQVLKERWASWSILHVIFGIAAAYGLTVIADAGLDLTFPHNLLLGIALLPIISILAIWQSAGAKVRKERKEALGTLEDLHSLADHLLTKSPDTNQPTTLPLGTWHNKAKDCINRILTYVGFLEPYDISVLVEMPTSNVDEITPPKSLKDSSYTEAEGYYHTLRRLRAGLEEAIAAYKERFNL